MKYVFLIGTEHQLFQVDAAIKHFNIKVADAVLVVFHFKDDYFSKKAKNFIYFRTVIALRDWTFKDLCLARRKHREFIEWCHRLKGHDTEYTLFASHYDTDSTLLFLSIVKPSRFYLMDEGSASFTVRFARSRDKKQNVKLLIKSLLYGYRMELPKHLTYFTRFSFNNTACDQVERYSISKIDNPLEEFKEDEAIFLGDPLVEGALLQEEVYLAMLLDVYNRTQCSTFYYFPHRNEKVSKLLLIQKIGFKVNKMSLPFEKWFAELKSCPALICSLFATGVIDNISRSNNKLPELIIYLFDVNRLIKDKEIYREIYSERQLNKVVRFVNISNPVNCNLLLEEANRSRAPGS